MLQNAYLVAKIGAETAENEQHFAEILPKFCQPTLSDVAARVLLRVGARRRRGAELLPHLSESQSRIQ